MAKRDGVDFVRRFFRVNIFSFAPANEGTMAKSSAL
jgi:hypothetical protein